MIANRQCIECGKHWYLPPKKPRFETKEEIGEKLVNLAIRAVRVSTFVCPNCIVKEVERWETDGGTSAGL